MRRDVPPPLDVISRDGVPCGEPVPPTAFPQLLGESRIMRVMRERLIALAQVPWPVILSGRSGTGKRVAAHYLHAASPRRAGPFVTLSMTTLAAGLEHDDLAGHVAGAFTGARGDRIGAVESAHGGTLFLDEILDASPAAQGRLLHILEDAAIARVGEVRARSVDVRIVVATNRSIAEAVLRGEFRPDLSYRLGSLGVRLPALVEHLEDVPLIAAAALARFAADIGQPPPELPESVLERLLDYSWPGNVRELENALRHYLVFARLPDTILRPRATRAAGDRPARIRAALAAHGGTKRRAAQALGVSRSTLYRWLADARDVPSAER
jgi:DNA-binding NtrC family response regulator